MPLAPDQQLRVPTLLPPAFDTPAFLKALATFRFKTAARMQAEYRRAHILSYGIAKQLHRVQGYKPVSTIVHNRRDLFDAKYLYGLRRVFDHPLAYLAADEVEAVRADASPRQFPMLDELPDDAVLIGVFGFLNEYKGFTTAIQALQHLPKNHHLLIFGGIHPQHITRHQARHPYISSLFDEAHIDATLYGDLNAVEAGKAPQLVISAEEGVRELLGTHPRDLSDRIHFMGALAEDFRRHGDLRRRCLPLPRGRPILLGADLAGAGAWLPHHCLAHPHLSRIRRVP
jgi:glycosyltransferase involved in cell wall biosynthesis